MDLTDFTTSRSYPVAYAGAYPDPVEPVLFWPYLEYALTPEQAAQYIDRTNNLIATQSPTQWPAGSLYPAYFY